LSKSQTRFGQEQNIKSLICEQNGPEAGLPYTGFVSNGSIWRGVFELRAFTIFLAFYIAAAACLAAACASLLISRARREGSLLECLETIPADLA